MTRVPWRGALGVALTVLLLWWAFRGVPWSALRAHLVAANPWLALLSVAVATSNYLLRARRWRPILHPVAPNLPFGPLWRATAIGMMANNVLPARLGELVRAYAVSRETTVTFASAFASLVVDRAFDAFIVLVLMVLAMLSPAFPPGASAAGYAVTGTAVLVAAGLAMYAVVFFPDRLIRLYELFARRVAPRYEEQGRQLLRSFAEGLGVLRHPRRFLEVTWWALLLWLTMALSFWIMFLAFDIRVPFSAACFVLGLVVIGVAAPSTPGFFGLFEAAGLVGLTVYSVENSRALAWALTFHVLSLVPITVIGLYYLARSGMRLGELNELKR